MSTCPEKDIHSLYIDGELPASYVAEYEAHLASCASCRSQLDRLRSIHSALAEDAASLGRTEAQMEESFGRLEAKLSYSRTMRSSSSGAASTILRLGKSSGFIGALAGAAAAFAVAVLVPGRTASRAQMTAYDTLAGFEPVARTHIQPTAELAASMSPLLTAHGESTQGAASIPAVSLGTQVVFVDQTDGRNSAQAVRASLASYDVFAPVVDQAAPKETRDGFSFRGTSRTLDIPAEAGAEN